MPVAPELRLLVLGTSGDLIGPRGGAAETGWLEETVTEITGRRVWLRLTPVYPTPGLSRYVARCLDEFNPDVVLLHVAGHFVSYAYVGAYLESIFGGRLAPLVRRLSAPLLHWLHIRGHDDLEDGAARLRRVLYYAGRNILLRIGLGRPFMTVDAAASAYEAAIGLVASHEQTLFAVRGPGGHALPLYPRRLEREARTRIAALDDRLRRISAAHRVPFRSPLERLGGGVAPHSMHHPQQLAIMAETDKELLRALLE